MMWHLKNEIMKAINRNKLLQLVACVSISVLLSACNLFGLEIQQDFEYKHADVALKMNIDEYQFIESRKSIDMSMFYQAINRAGMVADYKADSCTFIVMNDNAFASYLSTKRFATVDDIPVAVLQNLLKQYIIKGRYMSGDLSTTAIDVPTLDPNVKISLALKSLAYGSSTNKYNVVMNFTGSAKTVSFYTSNLQPTNGVCHVINVAFLP